MALVTQMLDLNKRLLAGLLPRTGEDAVVPADRGDGSGD